MIPSTNILEFTLDVRRFADKLLPEAVIVFHKKVTMELLTRIVKKNPVLTGRSRSNWSVDTEAVEDMIEAWQGRDSVQAGLEKLANLKAYAVVYVFNNVPYIVPLEEGWSQQQAPNGFVALSIAEVEEMFA